MNTKVDQQLLTGQRVRIYELNGVHAVSLDSGTDAPPHVKITGPEEKAADLFARIVERDLNEVGETN